MRQHRTFLLLLSLACLLAGCVTVTPASTPEPFPTGVLMPYLRASATPAEHTPTAVVAAGLTPAPSPTPFTHVVASGETMLGIAYRYGIGLEELQAANPSVDAQFLPVGTALIIPLGGEIPQTVPTTTPVPVAQQATTCYRTGDGGAWCFVLLANDQDAALENLSAWVGLYDAQGGLLAGQVAVAPLNRLLPGSVMPLVVFFPPPLAAFASAHSQLLTALTISDGDARYLDAGVQIDEVQIAENGLDASVRGQVLLPAGQQADRVWLMLVAYAQDGQVVGVRKVEMQAAGVFDEAVYSLGPAVARVDVLVEAQPAAGGDFTPAAPE